MSHDVAPEGAKLATMNPWLARRVIGFAHQGGAAEGTPSTIEAMRRARANGAAALEFDLHLTNDGMLLLHHDPEFVIDGLSVKIAEKSLAELRAAVPDVAILDDVLAAFPGVPITAEVKARDAAERAARMLAGEVGSRPVIVTAFAPGTVAKVKEVAALACETASSDAASKRAPTSIFIWILPSRAVSICYGANQMLT